MADLLPSNPDVEPAEEPRVIGIDSEDASELLSVLTSDTAREILARLHEEPTTPARLADAVDTSLQNAQYHLRRLESAGVVEVADTAYSEKGREMNVYAPADRALVVVAGQQEETTGLKTALSRLLGGVGVLGLASAVLDQLLRGSAGYVLQSGGADGGDGGADGGDGGAGGTDGGTALSGDGGGVAPTENATNTATPTPAATGTSGGAESTTTPTDTGGFDVAEATPDPSHTAAPTSQPTEAAETVKEAAATATPAPAGTPTPAPAGTPTPAPAGTPTPAATSAPTATPTPAPTAADPVTTAAADGVRTVFDAGGPEAATQVLAGSPGLLFFLGGTTVLLAWFAFWALRR